MVVLLYTPFTAGSLNLFKLLNILENLNHEKNSLEKVAKIKAIKYF